MVKTLMDAIIKGQPPKSQLTKNVNHLGHFMLPYGKLTFGKLTSGRLTISPSIPASNNDLAK